MKFATVLIFSANQWATWFTVSMDEVKATYFKWARLAGYESTGIR